jgi:hypothetical protein
MLFLLAALASIGLAWVRGAPPARLAAVRLRWLALPLAAFAIRWLAFAGFGDVTTPYALWLQLASSAPLLGFLLANLRFRGLALVAVGHLLNVLVITANGGFMPVDAAAVARTGFPQIAERLVTDGHYRRAVPLTGTTRLPWLADVIELPPPVPPVNRLISFGDIVIAAGVFLFLQEALVRRTPARTMAP